MDRRALAFRLIGVGFFIAGSIILGVLVGLWLDTKLNTRPILVIVGLIIGIATAFLGVYQMLLPLLGNHRDKESR